MMHKLITLLFCLTLFSVSPENMPVQQIFLTGYVINDNSDVVGEVLSRQGKITSATVSGKDAAVFSIGKDNVLHVRSSKLKSTQQRFEIEIRASTSSGEVTSTFIIIKNDFIRNRVVAHRGAWKNTGAPENSIASLKHAIKLGCEGSEFDVHMSSDSVPLVNHDNSIQGVSIAKSTASELLKISLPNGEPMPTLEGYLKTGMEQLKTKLILEIKSSEMGKESSIALTRKIVAMVESLHAQAWVDYIAFDFDVCREVLRLAPYAKVAYLNGDKSPEELVADHFFGLDYHFKIIQKNPDWIRDAHERKLTVNVWTVNDADLMKDLLKQNVEFITTNEPEALLDLIRSK
ncbi:glycerophosphodiester phosphodiesterase family protein [Chryseolinea sp. T2]|uniref:glycerophosphodiester phosphodiesterase n=1 Tax=Chryseolinea sp. T2 TaxID=3129255 RepID=UPI00307784E6